MNQNGTNERPSQGHTDRARRPSEGQRRTAGRRTASRRMAHRKSRGKMPLFYIIYFACIAVGIVLLVFSSAFLRSILAEYESVQPKHIAQEIFDTTFAQFDYRNMQEYFDVDQFLAESGYESKEELFTALAKLTEGGEASLYRSSSGIGDTVEYSIAISKTRVASFTLKKSSETTTHGFSSYVLDEITVYNPIHLEIVTEDGTKPPPTVLYTYTITAPLTHTVSVNGQTLTEEDRKGDILYNTEAMKNSKSGFSGIPMACYEFNLENEPTVTAVDLNGDAVEAEFDEKARSYTFAVTFDRTLTSEFGSLAIEIAEKLAIYMQAGARFNSISQYYDPSSALYEQVRLLGNDAWMVVEYESCDFKDQAVSEAYRYSDTEFSIRVSLLQTVHLQGKPDMTDPVDYTFCFHLVEGNWLLYESYNN